MQPLSLLNSAGNFLTVVGSFNVFLGPLKGIMFADDFLIRKRTMELTGLDIGTFGDAPVLRGVAELDVSSISEAGGEKSRAGQKVQIV
ncbi:NCS1 nucleoside transporter [Colletotrichum filicis]|nr:NCS1 nucleoside transporter [Colletotrichum filicis]